MLFVGCSVGAETGYITSVRWCSAAGAW